MYGRHFFCARDLCKGCGATLPEQDPTCNWLSPRNTEYYGDSNIWAYNTQKSIRFQKRAPTMFTRGVSRIPQLSPEWYLGYEGGMEVVYMSFCPNCYKGEGSAVSHERKKLWSKNKAKTTTSPDRLGRPAAGTAAAAAAVIKLRQGT